VETDFKIEPEPDPAERAAILAALAASGPQAPPPPPALDEADEE
jgi:hypothetical protein